LFANPAAPAPGIGRHFGCFHLRSLLMCLSFRLFCNGPCLRTLPLTNEKSALERGRMVSVLQRGWTIGASNRMRDSSLSVQRLSRRSVCASWACIVVGPHAPRSAFTACTHRLLSGDPAAGDSTGVSQARAARGDAPRWSPANGGIWCRRFDYPPAILWSGRWSCDYRPCYCWTGNKKDALYSASVPAGSPGYTKGRQPAHNRKRLACAPFAHRCQRLPVSLGELTLA